MDAVPHPGHGGHRRSAGRRGRPCRDRSASGASLRRQRGHLRRPRRLPDCHLVVPPERPRAADRARRARRRGARHRRGLLGGTPSRPGARDRHLPSGVDPECGPRALAGPQARRRRHLERGRRRAPQPHGDLVVKPVRHDQHEPLRIVRRARHRPDRLCRLRVRCRRHRRSAHPPDPAGDGNHARRLRGLPVGSDLGATGPHRAAPRDRCRQRHRLQFSDVTASPWDQSQGLDPLQPNDQRPRANNRTGRRYRAERWDRAQHRSRAARRHHPRTRGVPQHQIPEDPPGSREPRSRKRSRATMRQSASNPGVTDLSTRQPLLGLPVVRDGDLPRRRPHPRRLLLLGGFAAVSAEDHACRNPRRGSCRFVVPHGPGSYGETSNCWYKD